MIAAFGRALTIIALCLSLGLHWLALQSVAWTAMLVSMVLGLYAIRRRDFRVWLRGMVGRLGRRLERNAGAPS